MKKLFKRKEVQEVPETKQNAEEMLLQLQQQLVALDKKVDLLINQTKDKISEGRPFSKPFQRFDRHDRHSRFDRGNRDNSFRERKYTKAVCADCGNECEVPFRPSGDRPVYCNDCFAKRKGSGGGGGGSGGGGRDFPRERHFDKHEGGENRRHGRKGKPNFRRRKERS